MNVLVLLPLSDTQKARLEAAAPGSEFVYVTDRSDAIEGAGLSLETNATDAQVAAADVIIGNIPCERLAATVDLKFLQLNSAGYDRYVVPGALPAGTVLANSVGAYGQAVSEHLFAMVLGLMKNLPAYRDGQRERSWEDRGPVSTMHGARVVVLGCGDIGSHFAQLCRGVGAHVAGVRRHVRSVPEGFESVHAMDELSELLPGADVVASFLPSTNETRGLADASFFASMRTGAYFANGGRGDLVDAAALDGALRSGHLGGAALDVTSPEPLPRDSPLWDAPNCFITPHVSGGFHLSTVLDNVVDIAAENLRHLAAGEPIRNAVAR